MQNVEYRMQNEVGAALARARSTSAFCLLPSAFPPAFTLVELMIVMVVISIMVGFTIPISKYVTLRARQANQRIYIEKLKSALEDYRAAYGEYPITPSLNNYDDAVRHYSTNYYTRCYYTGYSPYINVVLVTNTVEIIRTEGGTRYIDYALTYPLMLKQLESGARPFMDFKEVTVAFLIYNPREVMGDDVYEAERKRKTKGGGTRSVWVKGIRGNPVNRHKAIDPVSQNQWKYTSSNGVTYSLTTNSF